MAKNITLKLDENILQECKRRSFEEDKSVSQWVSDLIVKNLSSTATFANSKKYALAQLRSFNLAGAIPSREDLHERD